VWSRKCVQRLWQPANRKFYFCCVLFLSGLSHMLHGHAFIFRPHRLHAVHKVIRCGLLLQMSHVAWSVCLSVCWSHECVLQKQLNRSRCRLGLTHIDPRNHVLDGSTVKIGWIHLQPQGLTSRRCDLLPNYFSHLFYCRPRWYFTRTATWPQRQRPPDRLRSK